MLTTTTVGFYEGRLVVDGEQCSEPGEIGHTADGRRLECITVDGASVLSAGTAPRTAASTTPTVKAATTTRADAALAQTGSGSATTALVAVMILSAGVVMWGRATKKQYDQAWLARHGEPYQPVITQQEPDDRWHW